MPYAHRVNLAGLIRDVPDFPEPGIIFRDITPLLLVPEAARQVTAELAEYSRPLGVDLVVQCVVRLRVFDDIDTAHDRTGFDCLYIAEQLVTKIGNLGVVVFDTGEITLHCRTHRRHAGVNPVLFLVVHRVGVTRHVLHDVMQQFVIRIFPGFQARNLAVEHAEQHRDITVIGFQFVENLGNVFGHCGCSRSCNSNDYPHTCRLRKPHFFWLLLTVSCAICAV